MDTLSTVFTSPKGHKKTADLADQSIRKSKLDFNNQCLSFHPTHQLAIEIGLSIKCWCFSCHGPLCFQLCSRQNTLEPQEALFVSAPFLGSIEIFFCLFGLSAPINRFREQLSNCLLLSRIKTSHTWQPVYQPHPFNVFIERYLSCY